MIGITAAYGGQRLLISSVIGTTPVRPVGLADVKPVAPTLRAVWAAVTSTAAQIPRRRVMVISAAIVILVALVLLVPLPNSNT